MICVLSKMNSSLQQRALFSVKRLNWNGADNPFLFFLTLTSNRVIIDPKIAKK